MTERGRAVATVKAWSRPLLVVTLIFAFIATLMLLMLQRVYWKPDVVPSTGPDHLFSEARALEHLHVLAVEIGNRQLTTLGCDAAREYLIRSAQAVAVLAATRPDLKVEVHVAPVSGTVSMSFVGCNLTNTYRHLHNVALSLTPIAAKHKKGLLVVAHYDSPASSKGAADDASHVATMLEVARALVSENAKQLAAPVTFLFTGGEETLSQAAHGFAQSSPLMAGLGAFINLESLGGGGMPIVFQHTGSWVMQAYAKGAPYARGSRVAQDIFDLGIIPADSDFRMFSSHHHGVLPGLDIASVFGSQTYHTHLDTYERILPGTLQEMGENLLGASHSFTAVLAADAGGLLGSEAKLAGRSVYFDILGMVLITYEDSLGRVLHHLPLLMLTVLLPLGNVLMGQSIFFNVKGVLGGARRAAVSILLAVLFPIIFSLVRIYSGGAPMLWFAQHWVGYYTMLPVALAGSLLPWLGLQQVMSKHCCTMTQQISFMSHQVYGVALVCAAVATTCTLADIQGFGCLFGLSAFLCIAVAAVLGTGRLNWTRLVATLTLTLIPLAIMAPVILVFMRMLMERSSLMGAAPMFAADAIISGLMGASVLTSTGGCLLPLLGHGLSRVRVQFLALMLLISISVAGYANLNLRPYSYECPRRVTLSHLYGDFEGAKAPLAASAACQSSGSSSSSCHAGSSSNIGRTTPDPILRPLGQAGQQQQHQQIRIAIGTSDPTPLTLSGLNFSGPDLVPLVAQPSDFAHLYPVSTLLSRGLVSAPWVEHPLQSTPPHLRYGAQSKGCTCGHTHLAAAATAQQDSALESSTTLNAAEGAGQGGACDSESGTEMCQNADPGANPRALGSEVGDKSCSCSLVPVTGGEPSSALTSTGGRIVHLEIWTPRPCWGVLNITGPLAAWSFADELRPSASEGAAKAKPGGAPSQQQHIVRFTSEHASQAWPFWLQLQPDNQLNISQQDASHGADVATPRPKLRIELSASFVEITPGLQELNERLPADGHAAVMWLAAVFQSAWEV